MILEKQYKSPGEQADITVYDFLYITRFVFAHIRPYIYT